MKIYLSSVDKYNCNFNLWEKEKGLFDCSLQVSCNLFLVLPSEVFFMLLFSKVPLVIQIEVL